jgi:hypothetical protein
MPIRFRCVYCDQLLGIAKRKAGSVVKCPNCAGQLMVPSPDASDDQSEADVPTAAADDIPSRQAADASDKTAHAPAGDDGAAMLFERSDFDELLKPAIERREPALAGRGQRGSRATSSPATIPASAPSSSPAQSPAQAFDFTAPAPQQAPASPPPSLPRMAGAKTRTGILLTPVKLILLSVLVMVGMAFAFGGGLMLGWYLHK